MDAKLTRRAAIQSAGAVFAIPAIQSDFVEKGSMPFTPKFVDLVRNTTSVTGTGPVVLGAAVSGYTSLADAVSAGEQFYYSLQGVDKVQEREVGRGTMQADGRVARQPIAGSLTNFTSGTKTIALVTAAEWFAKLEQAGGFAIVATRGALAALPATAGGAAILTEAGREGLFLFEAGNKSALVTTDVAQGIHIAPASDPGGASGAWVRQHDGPVNLNWFGAVADDASDIFPAVQAALACLAAMATTTAASYQLGMPTLRVPAGKYYCGQTIDVYGQLVLEGEGTGLAGSPTSQIRFPAGRTGIRVQRSNTSGLSAATSGTGKDGGGSIVRGLDLVGGHAGTEGEFHGVQLRARAAVEDCRISNFQGDGIHINATAGAATYEGNANNWAVNRVSVSGCRSGLYAIGGDANAGLCQLSDFSGNRRWGIDDRSFLGNSYVGCHAASNGYGPGVVPSGVNHNGRMYVVVDGQEAGAATNPPSGSATDNGWWYYLAEGTSAFFPSWANGVTVKSGGPYRTDNPNAANVLIGCYTESGQPPSQLMGSQTLVIGGLNGAGIRGGVPALGALGGSIAAVNGGLRAYRAGDVVEDIIIGGDGANGSLIRANRTGYTGVARWAMVGANIFKTIGYVDGDRSYAWSGNGTTLAFGRSAGQPNVHSYRELALGNGTNDFDQARILQVNSGPPASGSHARGEVIFNRDAAAGGIFAWICTASGAPGSWAAVRLGGSPVMSQAGAAYTAAIGDADSYIRFTSASAVTVTVPPASAVPFPVGTVIEIEQAGAGALSVEGGAGVTIDARGGDTVLAGQFAVAALKKVSTDGWVMTGDL